MKPTSVYYIKTYERDQDDYVWHEIQNQFGYFKNIDDALKAVSKDCKKNIEYGHVWTFGDNRWCIETIETLYPKKYFN